MKKVKFNKAVRKAYEELDVIQINRVFFREETYGGRVGQACMLCAALIGTGYNPAKIWKESGDTGIYTTINHEFNMTGPQMSRIMDMNDEQELEWKVILTEMESWS